MRRLNGPKRLTAARAKFPKAKSNVVPSWKLSEISAPNYILRVVSHPAPDQELEAAARWYEERQPGLGDDFLDDFELALRRVINDPKRPRFIQGENRKL